MRFDGQNERIVGRRKGQRLQGEVVVPIKNVTPLVALHPAHFLGGKQGRWGHVVHLRLILTKAKMHYENTIKSVIFDLIAVRKCPNLEGSSALISTSYEYSKIDSNKSN